MLKFIFHAVFMVILGALGAMVFTVFVLPQLLVHPSLQQFQFIKDFKEGKIVVNEGKTVYIQETTAIEEAIERAQRSVVAIKTSAGVASGLIVTSDGLVATAAAALPPQGNFQVFLFGEPVAFTVVKRDIASNVALLKIDKKDLPTVGFGDTGAMRLGQKVFLVAAASEINGSFFANAGTVRRLGESAIETTMAETRLALGSPLFTPAGELVGLNYLNGEGKVVAVPVKTLQNLIGL